MFAPRASSVISLIVKYLGLVLKKSSSQSMILSHTLRISHSGASSAPQPVRKRAQSLDPPRLYSFTERMKWGILQ